MRADLLDSAIELRTSRLANQAVAEDTLVSQEGSAQAERVEITQIITASGVASLAGTANQVSVSAPTGAVTLSLPSTVSIGTAYQVAGTQVVRARETGYTAGTGTANKGAFATYAGQNVSAAYVEAEAQATDDAVKANSQRIKALEDSLRTHGLID